MISAVIPVLNEEQSLSLLIDRLVPELKKINKVYEIIFVDDGSTDASLKILKELREKNKNIQIFSFRRNQGKAEALTLGFQMAKGDIVVTLDADLQDRPEELEKMYRKFMNGYDLVGGWRKNRKDMFVKKTASKFFNNLMGFFWGIQLHDYNCGLKMYTKNAAKSLSLYGGMHRFIPLLLYEQGFLVTEQAVNHDSRKYGKSKYGISKLWKDIPDMFTILFISRYSKRPLHFFWTVGGIAFFIGLIILFYLWMIQLQGHSIGRRPLLFVGFFAVISGLQIFFTGFLADLMTHLFHNQQSNKDEIVGKHLLKYSTEI